MYNLRISKLKGLRQNPAHPAVSDENGIINQ
jgi:hypothetical protein